MPRDYSRYRDERPRSRNNSQKRGRAEPSSGMMWLMVGVIIGLCVAGLAYLNQNKERFTQLAAVVSPSGNQQSNNNDATNVRKSVQQSAASQPKFDFYNMLPATQVSEPTATDQSEAVDKSAVQSKKLTPISAQANAILSGVTPPARNQNNMNANSGTANANVGQATTQSANPNNQTSTQQSAVATNNAPTTNNQLATNNTTANNIAAEANNSNNNSAQNSAAQSPASSNLQPASTSASQSALSGKYVIQIAAFRHFADADQLKAQLAFSGIEVQISTVQKGKYSLERVWLGPYSTFNAAAVMQKKLIENQIQSTLLKVN